MLVELWFALPLILHLWAAWPSRASRGTGARPGPPPTGSGCSSRWTAARPRGLRGGGARARRGHTGLRAALEYGERGSLRGNGGLRATPGRLHPLQGARPGPFIGPAVRWRAAMRSGSRRGPTARTPRSRRGGPLPDPVRPGPGPGGGSPPRRRGRRRAPRAALAAAAAGLDFGPCAAVEACPPPSRCAPPARPTRLRPPRRPAALAHRQPRHRDRRRDRRHGRASARQGSLVYNPGGPGASGMFFPLVGRPPEWERVAAAYDLVGYAPRGVARSAPLSCQDPAARSRGPPPRCPPTPPRRTRGAGRRRPGLRAGLRATGRPGPGVLHDPEQRPRPPTSCAPPSAIRS